MSKKIRPIILLVSMLLFQNALFSKESVSAGNHHQVSFATLQKLVNQRNLDNEIFVQALSSQDVKLQLTALKGLGRIGGPEILELVIPMLANKNSSIRKAAVFAIGISAVAKSSHSLWSMLDKETNESVKQEIYLALGHLGGKNLASKLLSREKLEKELKTKAVIFQALAIAITYHQEASEQVLTIGGQAEFNFNSLLQLMENNDELCYSVGYFLARVKNIKQRISPDQLQYLIAKVNSPRNKKIVARLIGKVTNEKQPANRLILAWLIEQSKSQDVALVVETIQAMGSLLDTPQARLQLGKLQGSKNPLVAQSALQVLADSDLESMQMIQLLKKQLKSDQPAMVVAAMSGLIQRQQREEMSWAYKILSHKNTFVKIRFAQLIASKDKQGFTNVLQMLAKDIDQKVADYAISLLQNKESTNQPNETLDFATASQSIGLRVVLQTSAGEIRLKMNDQAIYTAAHFIQLVQKGFYTGTYFSRMIGNFVAQGGDSVGDMEGGSGQLIREELSYLSHLKGSVGMATNGKDTGDSQFFINLGDNIHLDRKYTIFADVVGGMENVYKLSNGDRIISAEVL